ncbi:TetR/AcrR family transcriptional regulator [Listeria ilorinensis]|uniref:TetR/AcrR family transcriptional regulator n=1 Tax=Listeria ilorinensis TaxID=2867439 RepID=UPI001EF680A1|nr:TetR family transcriptional regulator [Listeria ilorinensis]
MKLSRTDEMLFTRARILQTARDLFMEKGYRAVTTREIANRSLSLSLLYIIILKIKKLFMLLLSLNLPRKSKLILL